MTVPRLHVVTDDDVLADPAFGDRVGALMSAHGPALAVHLRGPNGPVARLFRVAESLAGSAAEAGTLLVVNGRLDVALAVEVSAVQLGRRSIPVQAARRLLGEDGILGYSAHGAAEAGSAARNGADFVFIGTIWETPSHPDRPGAGLARVREAAADTAVPVLAIGGVTPDRARSAVRAGAWGVAVIRGIWHAGDPVAAASSYLEAVETETA
ncbi:MAG: thiamine phosphate synthase [Candidatus Longimicrobiales bacterium M2_2A_002]